jgi:drug/metabolite transporter (DMT)-like permease
VTLLTGYVAFDEMVSARQIAGALLITGGLVLINIDY